VIKAEIVVGYKINEVTRRKTQCFDNVFQAAAGIDKDNRAIVALEAGQEIALLYVGRIVADDNFNLGPGPRTCLGYSRARSQIVPMRSHQNGEMHGQFASWMIELRRRGGW
jgi:hypothetical protein